MAAVDTSMIESDVEFDYDDGSDYGGMEENSNPNKKKTTKKNDTSKSSKSSKTIEQTYQKKTQLEHILLRPDTYIGSTEPLTQPMWVLNAETERIQQRDVTFTPGLFKIFDEIVVNAADNKQRDPNMDRMEVDVDAETNTVSVLNNGKGIPIVHHKEHDCYVPTLIFGHLLTGSNFDDDEKKTTGGRNGYGAKLANIFSKEFIVECVDSEAGLKFTQVFRNNMQTAEEPKVKKCSASEKKKGDYTKITFKPDLERFHMTHLDVDTVGLFAKRAYDIAGSMANKEGKKLGVYLNGNKLPVKDFKSYLSLFDGITPPAAYEKIGDRWEVGVSMSDGSFQQISFVNSIATTKGGGHVNYIADQVAKSLQASVKKKNKGGVEIKPNQIKNHLSVFVNCLVENPTFDSQTKENLTTRPSVFKSEGKLSDKFMKQVEKCGVVDAILSFSKFKQNQALKRKGGTKKTKLTGIVKLDDANNAGTAKSKDCTLIITEGDSAKSLAVSGLSVVGRDYYGVFPLKGKPLNVRDATHAQIMKNEEIMNVVEIMGLKFGTVYTQENIKTLRYGHLMIMADQDHDGSHIKGLVINFIHNFWPSLLDIPDFLLQFITPIVKCTKGKKSETFFTLPEYEEWKESTGNDAKGWAIKYYKGLGTSTSSEAKDYFSNLNIHEIRFNKLSEDTISPPSSLQNEDDDDRMEFEDAQEPNHFISTGAGLIEMAFSKSKVDDRKRWLNSLEKDTFVNYSVAQKKGINYSDFINRELVLFSQCDNVRSIPHIIDGFKPSQRKVLYACFKKKLKNEIKVAQLAGYIGEHSAYHHGEMSLTGAIIGMAQSYCGSNNINLLYPSGQFGTRRMGGKDHASARYIFTRLEKIARAIFHPDDDPLLNYLNDDGMSIEPEYYMPVIPLVLVNGSDGIGTGWSSTIQNHDPRDVISNIRKMINREEPTDMHPHFSGYTGEIIPETGSREGSYIVKGKIERTNDTTLFISELPIGKWTQDYKSLLEKMTTGTDKTPSEILDFKENHSDTTVAFTVIASKENIDSFEKGKDGLYGKFKLSTTISTNNMTAFDLEGKIHKYKTPLGILRMFFDHRLRYYDKRKDMLLEKMKKELKILDNKARFVEEVCLGDLVVSNRKRTELLAELQSRSYDLYPKDDGKYVSEDDEDVGEDSIEESTSDSELAKGYEYLLGMKIWTLTFERAEELRKQRAEKANEVEHLEGTTPETIWLADLDAIEEALDERDILLDAESKKGHQAQKRAGKAAAKKKKIKRKSNELMSHDSESDCDDEAFVPKKPTPTVRAPPKKTSVGVGKRALLELSGNDNDNSTTSAETKINRPVAKKAAAQKWKEKEASSRTANKINRPVKKKDIEERMSAIDSEKKVGGAGKTNSVGKKTSYDSDENNEYSSVVEPKRARKAYGSRKPAKTKASAKASSRKKVPVKAKSCESESESEDMDDFLDDDSASEDSDNDEDDTTMATSSKSIAKKKKKSPAKSAKQTFESGEEDSFVGDSESGSDTHSRERRAGRTTKKINYLVDSESDDSDF